MNIESMCSRVEETYLCAKAKLRLAHREQWSEEAIEALERAVGSARSFMDALYDLQEAINCSDL